jgi:antagonist of KipI
VEGDLVSISVVKPGTWTTVQDLGRTGLQKYGISVGGAMDSWSFQLANLLVGNDPNKPALELTLKGPSLELEQSMVLAICGADMSPAIDGRPIPMNRTIGVRKGSILTFDRVTQGCRAYLAIGGGILVPKVLGGAGTYADAGIGGHEGRALRNRDRLFIGEPNRRVLALLERISTMPASVREPFYSTDWYIGNQYIPVYNNLSRVRIIHGREYDDFDEQSRGQFMDSPFMIQPESNRMGYRLRGAQLRVMESSSMISEAVSFGTVQVPPQGDPIILMADRQTIGGYPRIAQVITADLPQLAQVKPGDSIRFQAVTMEEAQRLYIEQQYVRRTLATFITQKQA